MFLLLFVAASALLAILDTHDREPSVSGRGRQHEVVEEEKKRRKTHCLEVKNMEKEHIYSQKNLPLMLIPFENTRNIVVAST